MFKVKHAIFGAFSLVGGLGFSLANSSETFGNDTSNFTYDARGRLIEVEHSGSVNNNMVANYSYDDANNRVNVTVTGATSPP